MFTIEIAGIAIAVSNRFHSTKRMFKDYLSRREPLFTVSSSDEEMKLEDGEVSAYAEQHSIVRKISHFLTDYNAFLMHAAIIRVDGQGVGFAAQSGTGKSTRVMLWKKAMGKRVEVVNGDKPILRFKEEGLYAYGTPWTGKEGWGKNTSVPMTAMCFLERGEEVSLRRMEPAEVLPRLLRQILIPNDARIMNAYMALIERFARTVPCYLYTCNMDKEKPEEIWEQIKWDQFQSEQTA